MSKPRIWSTPLTPKEKRKEKRTLYRAILGTTKKYGSYSEGKKLSDLVIKKKAAKQYRGAKKRKSRQ